MAPKKVEKKAAAAEEPKAKKAKVEEPKKEEPKKVEPKKVEPKKDEPKKDEPKKDEPKKETDDAEKEKDAPADKRAAVKEKVGFDPADCTLNVLPTFGGKVLMSFSDGGMQFLIAGARANVGVKAGRYMFEVKVIEALQPAENPQNRSKVPLPRQLMRIGFSMAGSSLILGEDDNGVCFDAEGQFTSMKKKTMGVVPRIGKNQTIACLLNLEEKSPNYHTISLFREGERLCEPQKLPEAWKGETFYPHVCYRNVSLQVGFGPKPSVPLPFSCRMLATAAAADAAVAKPSAPKDGKYEIMFPVAFPDEGTFDWLDMFLEKNPNYVELSDRKIIDWAAKSGVIKPKFGTKGSGDKPEFNFGLAAMDDLSIRRVLNAVAPIVPRNYVVMEVKENLTEADRRVSVKRFANPAYKKVARVVMGEPNDEFKKVIQSRILKEKQKKLEAEWRSRKAEKDRKKQVEARQKQLADMKKAAEEKRKKAEEERKAKIAEEAKKKAEAAAKKKAEEEAKKKAEAGEAAEEGEEKKGEEDEKKMDVEKDEAKEDAKEEETKAGEEEAGKKEEKEDKKEEEEPKKQEESDDEPMPEAELTEEDKKIWFKPPPEKDLTPQVMSQAFGKFTLPKKEEGFDEIVYEWEKAEKANDYLRSWVLNKKMTSPVSDLVPSEWFKEKNTKFMKSIKEWQEKQKPFEKKKKEDEKKAAAKVAADEDITEDDLADDLDIFAVEDVCDVGNGEPLFVSFTYEDWALLTLRYELVLLCYAFKHDVNDEDYLGIHEPNLSFYYTKYYGKQLVTKNYGKDTNKDLIELVKDCVTVDAEKNVLKTVLEDQDSLDIFVKLTEEGRRERQRRVDAGDETARLKFLPAVKTLGKSGLVAASGPPKAAGMVKPAGAVRPPIGTSRPTFGKGK